MQRLFYRNAELFNWCSITKGLLLFFWKLICYLLVYTGNDNLDEDVDIGGNDLPISSFPPVEIEKDTALRNIKCSSSSSSSSESGSSSSGSCYITFPALFIPSQKIYFLNISGFEPYKHATQLVV